MKKLIVAAMALVAIPMTAQADFDINTAVGDVTVQEFGVAGIGTIKRIDDADVNVINGLNNNRNWLYERLETQIHYYNKATEKLGVDHASENGAYWGNVTAARDAIDALNADIDNKQSHIVGLNQIVANKSAALYNANQEIASMNSAWRDVCTNFLADLNTNVFAVDQQASQFIDELNEAIDQCNTIDGVSISAAADGDVVQAVTDVNGKKAAYAADYYDD